jgi:hypothetical protein
MRAPYLNKNSNFSSSLFLATPACQSLVRRAGRHQNTKFHEGKALTLCYSLCPLSLCGYFSPPHEKLLNTVKGYHISGYRKLPIYDELDLLKRSTYSTFSCLLSDIVPKDIEVLQQLCTNARLGFELWGNASRSLSSARPSGGLPEYYSASMPPQKEVLIAIAAKQQRQAVDVLESWKIISLKSYHHFQVH